MNSLPHVQIILLNWNGWQDTIECLRSLEQLTYLQVGITVVDNASSDDSLSRLRQYAPALHILTNSGNLGFAEGNNVGIRDALQRGAQYIWLLNNDTIVAPDSLSVLIATMEKQSDVGVCGPKIYFFEPSDTLWFGGSVFRPFLGQAAMTGYGQKEDGQTWEADRDVPWMTGCALVVKADIFERFGLLDGAFFYGMEDVDFGLRVRAGGLRCLMTPRGKIWHKVSASSGGASSPLNMYYAARNRLLLMRNHGGWPAWPTFLLHLMLSYLVQPLFLTLHDRASFGRFLGALFGIIDFFRGSLGPMPEKTRAALAAWNKS